MADLTTHGASVNTNSSQVSSDRSCAVVRCAKTAATIINKEREVGGAEVGGGDALRLVGSLPDVYRMLVGHTCPTADARMLPPSSVRSHREYSVKLFAGQFN